MALFSEVDWIVILAVGGYLLFGLGNGAALRQLGRWYGRAARLKQELLREFTAAAELPTPTPGRPFTLRQALLEADVPGGRVSGIPAAVTEPPRWVPAPAAAVVPSPTGMGDQVWAMATPTAELESNR